MPLPKQKTAQKAKKSTSTTKKTAATKEKKSPAKKIGGKKTADSPQTAKSEKSSEPRTVEQIIIEKRHEVRRLAAAMTYALVFIPKDLINQEDKLLPAEISAILVDESDNGCSLVFNNENPMSKYLAAGLRYVIELKGQRPRLAEARWKKSMDGRLINMGFRLI